MVQSLQMRSIEPVAKIRLKSLMQRLSVPSQFENERPLVMVRFLKRLTDSQMEKTSSRDDEKPNIRNLVSNNLTHKRPVFESSERTSGQGKQPAMVTESLANTTVPSWTPLIPLTTWFVKDICDRFRDDLSATAHGTTPSRPPNTNEPSTLCE